MPFYGFTAVSPLDHCWITAGSLLDQPPKLKRQNTLDPKVPGRISGCPRWLEICPFMVSLLDHCWITAGSPLDHCWITAGSLLDQPPKLKDKTP
jgi:hypothetical protein